MVFAWIGQETCTSSHDMNALVGWSIGLAILALYVFLVKRIIDSKLSQLVKVLAIIVITPLFLGFEFFIFFYTALGSACSG